WPMKTWTLKPLKRCLPIRNPSGKPWNSPQKAKKKERCTEYLQRSFSVCRAVYGISSMAPAAFDCPADLGGAIKGGSGGAIQKTTPGTNVPGVIFTLRGLQTVLRSSD